MVAVDIELESTMLGDTAFWVMVLIGLWLLFKAAVLR
jgi:hypothetical protein